MQALLVRGLAFAYSDAAPLFEDVHLHLVPGWHGLVGENGSGKTTLLRLVAGETSPDAGSVRSDPPGATLAVCAQEVHDRGPDVAALAARDDEAARRLRATLRLDGAAHVRWATLSPGERKRWQIGAALAREPDVLLLDEPTNHLDASARGWLVDALARHRGIGVVVSHDRGLLDALTSCTLRVHGGRVASYAGGYSAAKSEWERAEANARAARDGLRRARDAAERRLDDARRSHASADRARSGKARAKGAKDHDGRSMGAKIAAERAEASLGRRVEVRRAEAERASDRLASAARAPRELGGALFVGFAPCPRTRVLSAHLAELRAGDTVLARDVALDVARDARVRIAGPNGAGKTTLLRALLEGGCLPDERVLFLSQDTSPDDDARALAAVRALGPAERGRVLAHVAALGGDPARLLASARPSPGEARKLRIATGLGRQVWALVLDEPTNHLDLPSIERLESALAAYPGALVVVTHDDAFAAACARETWTLGAGERVLR